MVVWCLCKKINIYEPTFLPGCISDAMACPSDLNPVYRSLACSSSGPVMPGKQAETSELHPQQTQESMACYKRLFSDSDDAVHDLGPRPSRM